MAHQAFAHGYGDPLREANHLCPVHVADAVGLAVDARSPLPFAGEAVDAAAPLQGPAAFAGACRPEANAIIALKPSAVSSPCWPPAP